MEASRLAPVAGLPPTGQTMMGLEAYTSGSAARVRRIFGISAVEGADVHCSRPYSKFITAHMPQTIVIFRNANQGPLPGEMVSHSSRDVPSRFDWGMCALVCNEIDLKAGRQMRTQIFAFAPVSASEDWPATESG